MFAIYKMIFWLPTIASALMLWISLREGLTSRPAVLLVWFGGALLLQVVAGTFSPAWVVALILQTVLAVSLSIKWKLG